MKILESEALRVSIDENDLTVSVKDLRTGTPWQMQKDGPGDIGIKGHCGPWKGMSFRDAQVRKWEATGSTASSVQCTLTGWGYSANVWSPLGFGVVVGFALANERLTINVSPYKPEQFEASLIDSNYPRGFLFPKDMAGQLVLPYCQGVLLDKDDPLELDLNIPVWVGNGFLMPWFGMLAKNGDAVLATSETPDDLGFRLNTEKACGQTIHPYWQASLGGLKYTRVMHYAFTNKSSVVALAKAYRKHADMRGQGITLESKARSFPGVESLRGGIMMCVWMMSDFANFNAPGRVPSMSFDEGLDRYKKIAEGAGIKTAIAHIDGWCRGGYDFNHPDTLPPDERIGGWAGMKRMRDGIKALGHAFVIHDNFVDYYAHTPSFKNNDGTLDLSLMHSESTQWLGGRQYWMCSKQGDKYVRRNYTEIKEKLDPDGSMIDCWTMGHLRECFDQNHLCTRTEARESFSNSYGWCRNLGWTLSGEGGTDWAVPFLDFVETVQPDSIPHVLNGKTEKFGIAFPLYELVWHDCITVLGHINQDRKTKIVVKDGCYLEEKGDIRLWTLLWGGIPFIRPHTLEICTEKADLQADIKFVKSLKIISDLSKRVAFQEIVDWKMLDKDEKKQQVTYKDGTTVAVNFHDVSYTIKFPGAKEIKGAFAV